MRTLILLIAMFMASLVGAQEVTGTKITATVNNIAKTEGKVHFALFTEDQFMKKPHMTAASEVKNGVATVSFENVPQGTYAILVFHDENGNGQMDFQQNGMPLESYGASNNQMSYGPPLWTEASFPVKNEPLSLEIQF